MSIDPATTEDSRSTTPESRASATERPALALLPAHVVAFLALAIVAIVAAHAAAGSFRAGQEAQAFTAEVRRAVAFGLLFNLAIALALALGWLVELVAGIVRIARGAAPASRVLLRVALALVPAATFLVGHRIVNPWLPDLVRQLGSMARGG